MAAAAHARRSTASEVYPRCIGIRFSGGLSRRATVALGSRCSRYVRTRERVGSRAGISETHRKGRIGGFDPALYHPLMQVDGNGFPLGPPAAGVIEAGNALSQYSLPGVTRVGKRVVNSTDPNNFGPRVGLAWSPLSSGRLAIRAGYGIFYSRPSFSYLALGYFAPPFFLDSDTSGQPFSKPFASAPPESSFPLIQPGSSVAATVIDRNARTPYTQQFNTSVQYELPGNTRLQVAYSGSHGVKLFRGVAVNQAQIASLNHPVTNIVTGQIITDNSIENATLLDARRREAESR